MHRLNEQAADRARRDEEEPLGDARGDVVDLGLPGCEYLDILLAVWCVSGVRWSMEGGRGGHTGHLRGQRDRPKEGFRSTRRARGIYVDFLHLHGFRYA